MLFKIIIVFFIIFIIRIYLTKDSLSKINKISKQFHEFVNSNGYSEGPSNASFNKLYKIVFGNAERIVDVKKSGAFDGKRAVFLAQADVLASFPSTNPNLVDNETKLLSDLKDYYQEKYSENFSLAFWIRAIIFLPSNVAKYVGLKDNSITGRILNLLYWFLVPFSSVMRSNLISIVHQLLK